MRLQIILGAATLAAAAPETAWSRGASPVSPITPPPTWITPLDYPAAALKDQSSGTVTFRLEIGEFGIPTSCTILESSGSQLLDDTACALVKARGRFQPARNAAGVAVPSAYINRVRWIAPAKQLHAPPSPSNVELTFLLGADGAISNCEIVSINDPEGQLREYARKMCEFYGYKPYLDDQGKPVARQVTVRSSTSVEPVR
jgi:protein TonB